MTGALLRVDSATARVTQTIHLGGNPGAIAYGAGRVWVADESGRRLSRVHPATGRVERILALEDPPSALAVEAGAVWIASRGADTITALDPRTLAIVASFNVGRGPVALAAGAGSVWVANGLDDTVSRIDPQRPRVIATIPIPGGASGLVPAGADMWVMGEFAGVVSRISPAANAVTVRIPVGGQIAAIGRTGDDVLLATRPSEPAQPGGTLRMVAGLAPTTVDPAHHVAISGGAFLGLVHDGLVTYHHVGGTQGLRLVPNLAETLPRVTATSTTLHFRLRAGVRYSTGEPVRATDFRRAFERMFQGGSLGIDYFNGLRGATRCVTRPRACRLDAGVVADDAARTVTLRLTAPDPYFLYRLASLNLAAPVPAGTSLRNTGLRPVPGTGPYRIVTASKREVRFVRNPYFRVWSSAAQPAGGPDEIVWRFGLDPADQARAVRDGRADRAYEGVPNNMLAEVVNRHAGQLHTTDVPMTDFLQLNPRGGPFRDVRARRAFNFAFDRNAAVEAFGGATVATPTCQVLPRTFPARRDYCPYTRAPGPDGRWRGPDRARARRLVAAARTAGQPVTIWKFSDGYFSPKLLEATHDALRAIGYRPEFRSGTHDDYQALSARNRDAIDVIPSEWAADFPSPSNFLEPFLACHSAFTGGLYCDPSLDRLMRRARALEASEPQAAEDLWAAADRRAVDRAAWVPLVNQRTLDFTSTRLHNYVFNPMLGFLASHAALS